jgi:hypothetical protein
MAEVEAALGRYRARPRDPEFNRVALLIQPFLRSTALSALSRWPSLRGSCLLEDVTQEGLFAVARAARRFAYLCGVCGAGFPERRDVCRHAAAEHRLRGPVERVTLRCFVECSARLAIRRTVTRMAVPELPSEDPCAGLSCGGEDETVLRLLVDDACARLSASGFGMLSALLDDRSTRGFSPATLGWLRRRFRPALAVHPG